MPLVTSKGPPSAPDDSYAAYSPLTASYTLTAFDLGLVLQVNTASDVTVTLPNSLPAGFQCEFDHIGAGALTFAADADATLLSLNDYVDSAGAGSNVRVRVTANTNGVSAAWLLTGDLAEGLA